MTFHDLVSPRLISSQAVVFSWNRTAAFCFLYKFLIMKSNCCPLFFVQISVVDLTLLQDLKFFVADFIKWILTVYEDKEQDNLMLNWWRTKSKITFLVPLSFMNHTDIQRSMCGFCTIFSTAQSWGIHSTGDSSGLRSDGWSIPIHLHCFWQSNEDWFHHYQKFTDLMPQKLNFVLWEY